MTKPEFVEKYRSVMLGLMAESWAVRKLDPSSFGMVMDQHYQRVREVLGQMYDSLAPEQNGKAVAGRVGK